MDRIPFGMNPGPDPGRDPRRDPRRNTPPGAPSAHMGRYIAAAVVFLLLLFGTRLVSFWVDWRWFTEVGFTGVFWTTLLTQWGLALAFGALFLAIALPNVWLALRLSPAPAIPMDLRGQVENVARRSMGPLLYGASSVLAFLAALTASTEWNSYLLFRNAVPFALRDPVFNNDVGFYTFRLPFMNFVVGFLFAAFILTLAGVGFAYFISLTQYYDPIRGWNVAGRRVPAAPARHVSILIAVLLLLKAVGYWLQRYDMLTSASGVVTAGAAYADLHARLPVLYILMALCVVGAGVWIVQLAFRKLLWGVGALVAIVAVSLLGGAVYPGLVQQVRVKPNEFTAEEPYIRSNIAFTRRAYDLERTTVTDFPIRNDYTPGLIQRNAATIANARLWDYNIAVQAYRQLQEIKPYYQFTSVNVDRYTLNGRYRQVLIAAREMNQDMLPEGAKSFQNQHLVYTHGIGVCMSPVNEVSEDNQPTFFIKGIPPISTTDVKITQPRIYFGEAAQDWSAVGTSSTELDYPGTPDVYKNYDGKAGIRIGSGLSRAALAYYLGDQNFLLSRFLTPDSRLLIRRGFVERIETIAPFLRLDADIYPVVVDGRIVWMQDAYTTSDRFPYSESAGEFNYIRNSVKIAMDAYDGTMTFYVADPSDPIVQAYGRAFPGLFTPMSRMPAALRQHLRYPEDLFNLQSDKYLVYHMTDPKTFFTKEDAWDVPQSSRGAVGQVGSGDMEAYYVIMRLPGQKSQEMVMIRPFTPHTKNNMIAWMAARCDPAEYGKLIVYRFAIETLPLGPSQIDASILQKPEISKELTLLNQQGSQVVLGNMLTIPLENSLLYVQPLYVQSQNQGNSRAELVRVIVAYGDRIQMGDTLSDALNGIFGGGAPGAPEEVVPTGKPGSGGGDRALVRRAVSAFNRAQAAQRAGDWTGYGNALKELQQALRQLDQSSR